MGIVFQERAIDRQFALFICRQCGGEGGELFRLMVSLLSSAVGKGNICLALADFAEQTVSVDGKEIVLGKSDALMDMLRSNPPVGLPGEHKPLVLDSSGRIYLYRYWRYEQELASAILTKASTLAEGVDEGNLQKDVALVALQRLFCVISGGPGTGKTSTVVRILALLVEQGGGKKQKIAMAAPTGKAAARLKSSINAIRGTLACSDEVKHAIPDNVVTLQRLLGGAAGSSRFRYSLQNLLPFDTVIVDEASMISLPLMAALVNALKPSARLILLGDKDQLASVEAGSVLGDICSIGEKGSETSPLFNSLIKLEKNYRFLDGSGIAELGKAVNAGLENDALELLKGNAMENISMQELPPREDLWKFLACAVIEGYESFVTARSAAEALERFDNFRILTVLRDGPYGVTGINTAVEHILNNKGLINPENRIYHGRPILITVNDYSMQLFNGDTGILFSDPEQGGACRAFFALPDGGVRTIHPERLPQHETAFAMTIHKSQGSEFNRVLILLPPVDSVLLTRELIYSGITRAKHSLEIWTDQTVFCSAVRKKIERSSGLKDLLHNHS